MKLTLDSINNINLFEKLTRAKVRDCFTDNGRLVFLVEEGNVKKALGKDNSNLRKVGSVFKKEIKIIGFSEDVCKFVNNLIYPNKADSLTLDGKIVTIKVEDTVVKGRIFGRGRENLRKINEIVKKYFDVEVVVV